MQQNTASHPPQKNLPLYGKTFCRAPQKVLSHNSYRYDTGPDDFVNLIAHANLVLTPSFHGMVYSLRGLRSHL